jgi:hypothetical protein
LRLLTGIAFDRRINGWLRSSAKQVRDRYAATFEDWK